MSYGLKSANNKMAMARGAKFMHSHNLPGWYNKEGNLFGKTNEKLSKENRLLRYKLKKANEEALKTKRANSVLKVALANEKKWNKPRQSGVRAYSKINLKNSFKASIGPNKNGMGWGKVRNSFYPLIGTRRKGGGYIINLTGKSNPAKYNNVIKGILVY